MKQLIPPEFLFRFSIRCRYAAKLPSSGIHVVRLDRGHLLPFFGGMSGQRSFADVWLAWNEGGLGLAWEVRGKTEPIHGEPDKPKACDGLSLWLDTRDTRTIHRASRFCQRFVLAAHNGNDPGVPQASVLPIHRALDSPAAVDTSSVRIARFAIDADGETVEESAADRRTGQAIQAYRMEVFLPASVLWGFDPETNRRLGVFYRVRDRELGDQIPCASPELPYWEDPSLWCVLDLAQG